MTGTVLVLKPISREGPSSLMFGERNRVIPTSDLLGRRLEDGQMPATGMREIVQWLTFP